MVFYAYKYWIHTKIINPLKIIIRSRNELLNRDALVLESRRLLTGMSRNRRIFLHECLNCAECVIKCEKRINVYLEKESQTVWCFRVQLASDFGRRDVRDFCVNTSATRRVCSLQYSKIVSKMISK